MNVFKNTKWKVTILLYLIKYYICYFVVKIFNIKNDDLWLISERGDEAKDNGYAFYKYLIKNHKDIKIKYVITKKSSDYKKINEEDVVLYRSFKHYIYYITAKYLISTHLNGTSPNHRAFGQLCSKKLVKPIGKQVFLQHGIIKDYIPSVRKEVNPTLKLFICGAKAEYDYLLKVLGYSEDEIKYTGLARYDYLRNEPQDQILLMPTWREFLYKCNEKEFEKSEYFSRYNSLINNTKLLNFLKEKSIKLIFYPHYEIQKYLHLFNSQSDIVEIASKDKSDVQTLLKKSRMLITDYSSVFFDFGYMKKPVIYYQFDYDLFRATQYQEGYFSYEDDGFGDIFDDENLMVDAIIKNIDSNYELDEKYSRRRDKFFVYNDSNNCKRIYKEIVKL